MLRHAYNTEGNALSPLGEKIFLDRYALKDGSKQSLAVGDTVIAITEDNANQREVGVVTALEGLQAQVELRDGTSLSIPVARLDKPVETCVEDMMARVARGASLVENESIREQCEKDFRWLLDSWKFVPGGRILSACGTEQNLTYYNCYVVPCPRDSREGIISTLANMAEIMSRGGGVGINLSSLRPRYAFVKGVNGRSSGSVSWGALYSFVTGLIEQGGSRRGALMLILDVWHPDILEFIDAKRTDGKITNANISVNISNGFMEAVQRNEDWDLVFPDTEDPLYNNGTWNGNIEAWEQAGGKVITHRTVKAREVWDKIIESAWASAEPGVWFGDRCAEESNSWYYPEGNLVCTNPCVTGDTRILTDRGYLPIAEVAGTEVNVWNGYCYSAVTPHQTGEDQKLLKIACSDGSALRCTPYHKFILADGTRIEAKDLKRGDKLQKCSYPIIQGELSLKNAYTQGFFAGDGYNVSDRPGCYIAFYGDKKACEKHCAVLSFREQTELRDTCLVDVEFPKEFVPLNGYSVASKLEWLAGLADSDGNNQSDNSISISSVNKDFLGRVALMLNTLGVGATVGLMKQETDKMFPENCGGKVYHCQDCYHLCLAQSDIAVLNSLGFNPHRVSNQVSPKRNAKRFVSIASVEELAERENVYCFTEPKNHSGVFNGILTGQCGEQPLPAWGVCNLGHINLSKMQQDGDVDWDTLGKTVRLAVRFLDNIIDTTPYFLPENREQQRLERRVGLGTIGLAELLIRMKIRYGSPECEKFLDKLYGFIAVNAYEASMGLAKEKGSFPKFDAKEYLKSGFVKRLPASLRKGISKNGLRNVTLLTQAPTGTVGTMVGTSTGIEPFYFWSYTRKSRLGLHTERVAVLEEYEREHPDEPLPDYFVNAMELTPEEHVRVQAAIQKWVDSAISKTCNVPNGYTIEQTRELYELMHRLGCKGGTVYRDKSRDEQVLSVSEQPAKEQAEKTKITEPVREAKEEPKMRHRPMKRKGVTVSKKTPAGTCHIVMNDDEEGHPFEMFIEIGKGGTDIKAMAEALGRLASMLLRVHSPLTPEERVKEIVEQLLGIGGQRSMGFGKTRVKSLPDALAQALQENYFADECEGEEQKLAEAERQKAQKYASGKPCSDICPQCGNASFISVEGCVKCYICGHSEC